MLMDLMKDLKEIFIKQFGYTNTEDIHKLACRYLNTLSKKIKPTPRDVFISEELRYKNITEGIKHGKNAKEINDSFDIIKTKFEEGSDVNPYLSKHIFNSDYGDGLLNSWGIYHLHLCNSPDKKTPHLYRRSDRVLFCRIVGTDVYFIDVLPHPSGKGFLGHDLLKIIVNNWPEILERFKIQGIEGTKYTDDENWLLRQKGINTPITIDGNTYLPIGGGGISAKGTNLMHSVAVKSLIKTIREVEKQIINNKVSIREEISKTVPDLPDNLDFHLFLEEYGFVIKEINTDTYIFLDHGHIHVHGLGLI